MTGVDDLDAVGLLHEPLRRQLYEYVVAADHEVTRAEAADATGIQRTLAAFHLDKLVDANLLAASVRRVNGRSGPGAGRPAKVYRRAAVEHTVSLPARDYRGIAELLADVVDEARLDEQLRLAARRRGAALAGGGSRGQRPGDVVGRLAELGYEPVVDGDVVRMRNCPFHALSESHPALVCGMNLALLEGLLGDDRTWVAALDPGPDGCCTVLRSIDNQD